LEFHFPHWGGPVEKLEGDREVVLRNADDNREESPQILTVKSLEREKVLKGFKPDVAAGRQRPERNHIRLRGVGCP
jgi:hypothetical protein